MSKIGDDDEIAKLKNEVREVVKTVKSNLGETRKALQNLNKKKEVEASVKTVMKMLGKMIYCLEKHQNMWNKWVIKGAPNMGVEFVTKERVMSMLEESKKALEDFKRVNVGVRVNVVEILNKFKTMEDSIEKGDGISNPQSVELSPDLIPSSHQQGTSHQVDLVTSQMQSVDLHPNQLRENPQMFVLNFL